MTLTIWKSHNRVARLRDVPAEDVAYLIERFWTCCGWRCVVEERE